MKESELKLLQPGDKLFLKKPNPFRWGTVFKVHYASAGKVTGWVTLRFWNGWSRLFSADELLRDDPWQEA